MSISYPIDHPTTSGFCRIKWSPESAVERQPSPFSYIAKKYVWSGQRRTVNVDVPPMGMIAAKPWFAFGMKLNGLEGTFWLRCSLTKAMAGAAQGIGLVNGGSQTGQDLVTDGWLANISGLFKEGDWIQVGNRLHNIIADVDSNASGQATLSLWPKIRTAPADNLELPYGPDAKGLFELTEFPSCEWGVDRLLSGFTFQATEVIS